MNHIIEYPVGKRPVIVLATLNAGYDHQIDAMRALKVEVGMECRLVKQEICSFSTRVWVEEYPGVAMNSVFFAGVPGHDSFPVSVDRAMAAVK